jgi:hypothetical protein
VTALVAIRAEGQGVVQLALLDSHATVGLAAEALAGDCRHRRLLGILQEPADVLDLHQEPTPAAPGCLLCDRRFWCDRPPDPSPSRCWDQTAWRVASRWVGMRAWVERLPVQYPRS